MKLFSFCLSIRLMLSLCQWHWFFMLELKVLYTSCFQCCCIVLVLFQCACASFIVSSHFLFLCCFIVIYHPNFFSFVLTIPLHLFFMHCISSYGLHNYFLCSTNASSFALCLLLHCVCLSFLCCFINQMIDFIFFRFHCSLFLNHLLHFLILFLVYIYKFSFFFCFYITCQGLLCTSCVYYLGIFLFLFLFV